MSISWSQALAWRMQRHLLDPVGAGSVADVVRRLGAVPAMDEGLAELAVGARRVRSQPGEVAGALAEGRIIKSFAFRGATHYLSPEDGGAYLALRASGRQWELPGWREYYELEPADWPAFRESVREALADGPLTVSELGAAVTRKRRYRHLRPVFDEGAGTLVKPLTWQGDMSFGPAREGQHTFQRLDENPRWAGVWDLQEAGPYAIMSYLRTYGPATPGHIHYWLGNGLSAGRKRLDCWLRDLEDQLEAVDVEGETAYVLGEDVEDLMGARPRNTVRLLPGHDQWVTGPGTKDEHVVPPARRTPVTRKANLVVAGGVVGGTWSITGSEVKVSWFTEQGKPPRKALEGQAARLADGQPAFSRDLLLGTLTLYWATGTITSSLLPYWAYRHAPGTALPAGEPAPVPTAITIFGGERIPFPKPPRELAERYFHVTSWAEHDRGGHFPAVAEPRLLAQALRDAFRPLRS